MSGRRRSPGSAATEDHVLQSVAKEAEAKLAAKRAARAEARSFRMKELEKQLKQTDQLLDKQYKTLGSSSDELKKKKTQECDGNGFTCDKSAVEQLTELEEMYKRAMVSIAQLDNEKHAYAYQVEDLKDRVMELDEISADLAAQNSSQRVAINEAERKLLRALNDVDMQKKAISFRDEVIKSHGIDLMQAMADLGAPVDDSSMSRNQHQPQQQPAITVDATSTNPITSANKVKDTELAALTDSFSREREGFLEQILQLKEQLASLQMGPSSGIPDQPLEALKRDHPKQLAECKAKIVKLEQDNTRLDNNVLRMETQVKRYKSQIEEAEAKEETLIADKRKLARELRQAQDRITELETDRDQLLKRYEKLRQRRREDA